MRRIMGRGQTRRRRREHSRQDERAAHKRRFGRAIDGRRHQDAKPVHPRDRHWYTVGLMGGRFTLHMPTHGGGSYYSRYLAMHTAGAMAREKA